MTYLVFDTETTVKHGFKRKANPFLPENYVVLRGWKIEGDACATAERFSGKTPDNYLRIPESVTVLVGHNIKFDLHYEMCNNNPDLKAFLKRGGKIWCTQYAEYLLNGQQRKYHMCAMDDIIVSYGGRKKVDGIKALWEAGVQTEDIDPDLLLDYLIGTKEELRNSGDIGNTELIYLGQLEAAKQLNMLHAIKVRMDGLLATTDMEFNGLKIDIPKARKDIIRLNQKFDAAKAELGSYTSFIPEEVGFNWKSLIHVSCLIYGGTIKYDKRATYIDPATGELARKWETRDEPIGVYKNGPKKGQTKTKKVRFKGELKLKYQDFFYTCPGYVKPDTELIGEPIGLTDGKNGPVYSTSGDTLELLTKHSDIPFLKVLGDYNALNKEIGTYYIRYDESKKSYVGMLTCVSPLDHFLHHKLNHTSTVTTRLSSSDPNSQNLTRPDFNAQTGEYKSEVKSLFISRFGDDGVMIEEDYSQLEVVGQALLSGDRNLIRDLNQGIDFHCKRVALKMDCTYEEALYRCKDETYGNYYTWKKYRTGCKEFSFQRAYGAGAPAIAASTGMLVDEVKKMIELEDAAYPGVGAFNKSVERECNLTAEPFKDAERGWRTFRKGTWQAPTGTIYSFRTYDAPKWLKQKGIQDTFMPTELKNYPIQGTSGEIVQMVLGVLVRRFIATDNYGGKAFLVNTVHDCVWVDAHKSVAQEAIRDVKRIMEAVPKLLKLFYNIDCPVPFPVEAEVGPNMLNLHHPESFFGHHHE